MIETDRLTLREWRDEDEPAFAAATNTPAVMAHLGGAQAADHFAGMADRQRGIAAANGFCFWVMQRRGGNSVIGFCGLEPVDIAGVPISHDVEIGWRLAEGEWGRGLAREAAAAVLAWAWRHTALRRVVAMTVPANHRSWGLMTRLGLVRRPDLDFDHPAFGPGDPLRAHIVHAIDRG